MSPSTPLVELVTCAESDARASVGVTSRGTSMPRAAAVGVVVVARPENAGTVLSTCSVKALEVFAAAVVSPGVTVAVMATSPSASVVVSTVNV